MTTKKLSSRHVAELPHELTALFYLHGACDVWAAIEIDDVNNEIHFLSLVEQVVFIVDFDIMNHAGRNGLPLELSTDGVFMAAKAAAIIAERRVVRPD